MTKTGSFPETDGKRDYSSPAKHDRVYPLACWSIIPSQAYFTRVARFQNEGAVDDLIKQL